MFGGCSDQGSTMGAQSILVAGLVFFQAELQCNDIVFIVWRKDNINNNNTIYVRGDFSRQENGRDLWVGYDSSSSGEK